mmetsp:Transcript_17073/g.30947  ORF Transcript_17073/g.30947 Transcript_17073/m.30947 type:complete len:228 (+) Transcript_17073:517-1200(+)
MRHVCEGCGGRDGELHARRSDHPLRLPEIRRITTLCDGSSVHLPNRRSSIRLHHAVVSPPRDRGARDADGRRRALRLGDGVPLLRPRLLVVCRVGPASAACTVPDDRHRGPLLADCHGPARLGRLRRSLARGEPVLGPRQRQVGLRGRMVRRDLRLRVALRHDRRRARYRRGLLGLVPRAHNGWRPRLQSLGDVPPPWGRRGASRSRARRHRSRSWDAGRREQCQQR